MIRWRTLSGFTNLVDKWHHQPFLLTHNHVIFTAAWYSKLVTSLCETCNRKACLNHTYLCFWQVLALLIARRVNPKVLFYSLLMANSLAQIAWLWAESFKSYSTLFETLWESRFIGLCVFSAYFLIFTCGFKG